MPPSICFFLQLQFPIYTLVCKEIIISIGHLHQMLLIRTQPQLQENAGNFVTLVMNLFTLGKWTLSDNCNRWHFGHCLNQILLPK